MNCEVLTIPQFDKQVKQLAKKYPSLKNDLASLVESLSAQPTQGISLGNGFYKIRLAIASKGKGKSGGARVITYLKIISSKVYLSFLYDKSERATITSKELEEIFKDIP